MTKKNELPQDPGAINTRVTSLPYSKLAEKKRFATHEKKSISSNNDNVIDKPRKKILTNSGHAELEIKRQCIKYGFECEILGVRESNEYSEGVNLSILLIEVNAKEHKSRGMSFSVRKHAKKLHDRLDISTTTIQNKVKEFQNYRTGQKHKCTELAVDIFNKYGYLSALKIQIAVDSWLNGRIELLRADEL